MGFENWEYLKRMNFENWFENSEVKKNWLFIMSKGRDWENFFMPNRKGEKIMIIIELDASRRECLRKTGNLNH